MEILDARNSPTANPRRVGPNEESRSKNHKSSGILFIPDKKYNNHKFGKVTEIDKHDLTFLTCQGESITKPIRLVTPILQNIAPPNPEMKSNDSVDINSRKVNKKKNGTYPVENSFFVQIKE